MPVTDVRTDPTALTLTLTCEFDAPVERVWQLWADPRQLERWWGPPVYPATVEQHDLTAGGGVTYVMTGPEGDQHRGWWRIVSVAAPTSLEFVDGFADAAGTPDPDLPTTTSAVSIGTTAEGRTRMTITSTFATLEHMEQLVAMQVVEGLTEAMGQIDAILAG